MRARAPTLASIALAFGCRTPEAPVPIPADAPLSPAALRFDDAAAGERFAALLTATTARTAGWQHHPLERVGNFVQERWCSPTVSPPACAGGAVAGDSAPGTAWVTVATLFYPPSWPAVFGLSYEAGAVPADSGWGVRASLALDGRTITGRGYDATFLRVDGGAVSGTLPVGRWAYTLADTPIALPSPADDAAVLAELTALLASPGSLRETAEGRLLELETTARTALAEHRIQRCQYGAYRGDGIPPECTLVPLTPEEEAAQAARLGADLTRWRGWLATDAEALHAALVGVFPGLR